MFFLVLLFVLGIGMVAAHQNLKTTALQEKTIEYRFMPLSLDQWWREQDYSAFNVMTDMMNSDAGYCSMGTSITPIPTPFPLSTTSPAPTTAPPV